MKLLLSVLISFAFQHAFAQDTTVVEKRFSKKQLNADITYLTTTTEKVHPNMYHIISMQRYRMLVDSIKSIVHDDMTERQAWPALARLVGALGEGHSTFNYPDSLVNQLKRGSHLLFPVLIREFDGSHFVVRADASTEDKLLPGDLITSINGISAAKLIDTLSGYAGGLKSYRAIDVCRNLITYLYLYNIGSPYKLTYLRNGKPAGVTLAAISWSEFRNHLTTKANALPAIPKLPDFSFSYLNKNNACMVINSLTSEPDQFQHFLDSCFNKLKETPTSKLIIDLRRNGGGNSVLAEKLLGYLTDKPLRMTGGVRWKVSQEYKDQLNKKLKGEGAQKMGYYFSAANGSIISANGGKPAKPTSNLLQYKGKVFVLIGPRTFSSANMLANTIQDYNLATLVGEPSGEPANDYGELIFLKLPNTGFTFSTSTKQFVRANGNVKDQHPVLPEYKIADNPLTPLDEVIEFVKAK